ALVKYKLLAGGGMLKIVNRTVPEALTRLGYSDEQKAKIIAHIEQWDTIEDVVDDAGVSHPTPLRAEHLAVFDCAFKAYRGKRSINYMAHLKMMGATQPFISGAISKTVNLPNECTVEDIMDAYIQAWKMGLKCVAIYRDGSKRSQPLNTKKTNEGGAQAEAGSELKAALERLKQLEAEVAQLRFESGRATRRKLPDTRTALAHKFDIAGHEGYMHVGLFEDGSPGELFITMAKEGSTIGGLMDSVATLTSMSLQYGVPLEALVKKFAHQRFEPSGFTKNPEIRNASSIIDYVFRWMALKFIPGYREAMNPAAVAQADLPMPGLQEEIERNVNKPVPELPVSPEKEFRALKTASAGHVSTTVLTLSQTLAHFQMDAPPCPKCGSIAVRNGACYKCLNCGESLGCS
ncbi:MAG TPA: vitamin B12-dependent ribonucleotide reductase, partial [Methylomirabilota bacterium]|nr:vitamin B12-dependent ribonucleotide reductase [Methylomirabilota bacterium]